MPDTPKTNHNNMTAWKHTKKHHFAMLKNNQLFFIIFLFLSTCSFAFWKAVFCWNTTKIVFSEKTAFQKHS